MGKDGAGTSWSTQLPHLITDCDCFKRFPGPTLTASEATPNQQKVAFDLLVNNSFIVRSLPNDLSGL